MVIDDCERMGSQSIGLEDDDDMVGQRRVQLRWKSMECFVPVEVDLSVWLRAQVRAVAIRQRI